VPADTILLHANLGWARDAIEGRHRTTWSVAVERTELGPLDVMGELVGDDRDAPSWALGVRLAAIARSLFFDASFGQQIKHGRPRLFTLGLKYAF